MINIILEGHSYEYDLFQLTTAFFPEREICFLEDKSEYKDEGYFIESILYKKEGKSYAKANIYYNGAFYTENTQSVEGIDIGKEAGAQLAKIGVKKTLYDSLLTIGDREMPWGILTGIRPNKIVHDLLDREVAEEEIFKILTREYKLDIKKARLILNIAKDQRAYLYPLDKDRYNLYIGIPFCPSKCVYCSFPSISVKKHDDIIEEYVEKLLWEIREINKLMNGKIINTVYIGGGTPTAIPAIFLEMIIDEVYLNFGKENIKEFTIEAGRPDTINREVLTMFKRKNIDRISINPQTMKEMTLKLIGRNHSSEDIRKAYYLAREIGFKAINMDIILGLPSEDIIDVQNTLEEIEKLDPENLTVHTLAVKRGSKFKKTMDEYSIGSQETIKSMIEETISSSKRMEMKPYYLYRQKQIMGNFENVGYSKEKMECIYNMAIMEEKETIMAAGMGAVSKIVLPKINKIERVPNFKGMKEYLERTDELIQRKKKALEKFDIL